MSYINRLDCCGIAELSDILEDDKPEESLLGVEPYEQGAVIFSDTSRDYLKGHAIAGLIKKERLGSVRAMPVFNNPNTSNDVKMWVWRINKSGLAKWQKRQGS